MTLPSLTAKFPARFGAGTANFQTFSLWAPIPLRLIVGYGFLAHGYAKFSRGPETFAVVLSTLGVPMPSLLAWLTTLVEMIGGFAILIGAFVSLASLPMAVVLLTAMFTVHLDRKSTRLNSSHIQKSRMPSSA